MNDKQRISRKKKFIFFIITLCIPLITVCIVYIGFTVYRTIPLYSYVKSSQRGWSGKVHKADAELGFAPVPDSQGAHIFPIGSDIPMRFDAHGFRVPVNHNNSSPIQHPTILTLGCSFTYGDANYAENTYPYLVGQYLGGTTYNAGVCSYGLSQMLILARRLVPVHKPDYLIAQYSPWLIDRSVSPFAPTYFGKLPTPYFYKKEGLALHPPAFQTITMDIPTDKYRHSPENITDFIAFMWDTGLPLHLHDDSNMAFYKLKNAIGLIPEPTNDVKSVIEFTYGELAKIAKENNSKLIIVVLGDDHNPVQVPHNLFPQNALVVDAHKSLLDNLSGANYRNYMLEYGHLRGVILVDSHPNKKAHVIIAEKIATSIRSLSDGK